MAENTSKKKRVARIGNMSSAQGTANCENGLVQADCNLVYNIMESMNNSKNALSYKQLEESRSKVTPISQTSNSDPSSSNKQNIKLMKKFVPEKTFPLMAKCQKSMNYLKKNRCIPKPRAHVGFIPRPSQNVISNLKPNTLCNNNSVSNTPSHKENSVKIKQIPKKSKSCKRKLKVAHSSDNSCGRSASPAEKLEEETKLYNSDDTDSDNDFEQFLQKHIPENNFVRKPKKSNDIKRTKRKQSMCAKEITTQISRKVLSDSDESTESELVSKINLPKNPYNQQLPQKTFQRIVGYENSDDSASDVNDPGSFNYDSSSFSEDERIVINKSLNKENVNSIFEDADKLDNLPENVDTVFEDVGMVNLPENENSVLEDSDTEGSLSASPSLVAKLPASLSELKDSMCCDNLKLKCKIQCYVLVKRDSLLDQKAASFHASNASPTYTSASDLCNEDDDCVIVGVTTSVNKNTENITQSLENGNLFQRKSTVAKSSTGLESVTNVSDLLNKPHNNILSTETNVFLSNRKNADTLRDDEIIPSESRKNGSVSVFSKSHSGSYIPEEEEATKYFQKNSDSEDPSTTFANRISLHSSDLPKKDGVVTVNNDKATHPTEKDVFNVQILSVASVNESDVIVVPDNEKTATETVPPVNVTNECSGDDSDVEIICMDSGIINEKSENKNTQIKGNIGSKENPIGSSIQPTVLDDDCIILDDVDFPCGNIGSAKNISKVQPSTNVSVKPVECIEKTNSNKSGESISVSIPDPDKNSILKILNTIDFNCIKKVLNETTSTAAHQVESPDSVSTESKNSSSNNILVSNKTADPVPGKMNKDRNVPLLSQKQAPISTNISSSVSFKVNEGIFKSSPVNSSDEHVKFVERNNAYYKIIKNDSKIIPGPIPPNNVPSAKCDESSKLYGSNTNLPALILPAFGKEVVSNYKSRPNVIPTPNKQLLPAGSKMETSENTCDELDILAAKSIQTLDEKERKTIMPLLELFRSEYKKFKDIKCTEKNVTAGLKLLEEKQYNKLMHISASIKNLVKSDGCLDSVSNENKPSLKRCLMNKDEPLNQKLSKRETPNEKKLSEHVILHEKKPLEYETKYSSGFETEDSKVNIFHPLILEAKSVGPSSSQKVYDSLINCVCAECGKQAVHACSGCTKVYFCSEDCGIANWNKGHFATCQR